MSTDIENCPFCGSSNIAVGYHGQPAQTFHMRCVSCGAAGPTVNSSLPTGGAFPANVCESWNHRATPHAPTCHHRIADARNPYVESGYVCMDCGAVFAAADHAIPPAPTPAAPEGQAEAAEWMRKAIAETRTAASLFDAGEFRGGMETACDEIATRMALDGGTLPVAAEGQAGQTHADDGFARGMLAELARMGASPAGLSLAVQLLGVGACETCGYRKLHCRCPAAPLPRQAAVQNEDAARLDWLEQRGNDGGLLLHAGNQDTGGRSGLGLINTGRMLRQAVDSARGVKAVKSAPATTEKEKL